MRPAGSPELFADSLRSGFNDREANLSSAAVGFKLGFNSLEDNRLVVALTTLFAYSCRYLVGEDFQNQLSGEPY